MKCFKEKLTGLVVSFCREGFLIIATTDSQVCKDCRSREQKMAGMKRLCKVVHEVVTSDVCCNLGCANLWQGTSRTLQTGVPVLLTRLHLLCVPHLVDTGRDFPLASISLWIFRVFPDINQKSEELVLSPPHTKRTS